MKHRPPTSKVSVFTPTVTAILTLSAGILITTLLSHAQDIKSSDTNFPIKANRAKLSRKIINPDDLAQKPTPIRTASLRTAANTSNSPIMHAANSLVPLNPMIAPTDLAVHGRWESGKQFDTLTWSAVPGAASYTVFATSTYKPVAEGVGSNTITVPVDVWHNAMYSIIAIDSRGQESIPSAPAGAQGGFDPARPPHNKVVVPLKHTLESVRAVPEWNHGAPRIRISWEFKSDHCPFNIFRDGQKVGSGIWGTSWFDNQVKAGEQHTYTVSAVRHAWPGIELETPQSESAVCTAPSHPPAFNSENIVKIIKIVPNDDSAKISFSEVSGAADYRIFRKQSPGYMKYSGGANTIEMNDIDTDSGDDLIIEAVDKMGPFQTMDGVHSPGTIQLNGQLIAAINGQGDPSNEPVVLAKSAVFHVNPIPRKLDGKKAFFDNFRNEKPLIQTPDDKIDPAISAVHSNRNAQNFAEFQNDKWILRMYDAFTTKSKFFFMGSHFMDTLYDFNKVMLGKTFMIPKSYPKVAEGQFLHITFEVDAHHGGRRSTGVMIAPASDPLILPSGGGPPTLAGNAFDWSILFTWHQGICFKNRQRFIVGRTAEPGDDPSKPHKTTGLRNLQARSGNTGGLNGNMDTLDLRHRFDLYLSSKRYVAIEEGNVVKDVDLTRAISGESKAASDQTLDWLTKGPIAVSYYHYIYHSDADRTELMNGYIKPYPTYWINYRPFCDERHWDNMGFEVVDNLPNLSTVEEDSPPEIQKERIAKSEHTNISKPPVSRAPGRKSRLDGYIRSVIIKVPIIRP